MAAHLLRAWLSAGLALTLGAAAPTGKSWRECRGYDEMPAAARERFAACVAASGPVASKSIRVQLGDTEANIRKAASLKLDFTGGIAVTDAPVNLSWVAAGRRFVFENVGGTGEAGLELSMVDGRLGLIQFAWQNRPLNLTEALARAKQLQAWLAEAGYAAATVDERAQEAPFAVITGDQGSPSRRADSWAAAETLLSADAEGVEQMFLFTMTTAETEVMVSVKNMRRQAWRFQDRAGNPPVAGARRSVFDDDGGYEWLLNVTIDRPDLFKPPS